MKSKVKFLYFFWCVLFIISMLCLYFRKTQYGVFGLVICVFFLAISWVLQRQMLEEEMLKSYKAQQRQEELLERCRWQEQDFKQKEESIKEKAEEEINHFYSKISHSIRIPVSIISGYADLLTGGFVCSEEVRQEYLKKICARVTYMNEVLSLLLMEGRNESQREDIPMENVDIIQMLEKIASDISIATKEMDIAIKVVSSEKYIMIDANVMQLTKAFYNIIENSIKYMGRRGTINITITDFKEKVILIFRDDGLGLAMEETEHIFDLNFQGSNKKAGNGLGLYMTKIVVAAHGGEIYGKSDLNKGMGIYINIPKKAKKTKLSQETSALNF